MPHPLRLWRLFSGSVSSTFWLYCVFGDCMLGFLRGQISLVRQASGAARPFLSCGVVCVQRGYRLVVMDVPWRYCRCRWGGGDGALLALTGPGRGIRSAVLWRSVAVRLKSGGAEAAPEVAGGWLGKSSYAVARWRLCCSPRVVVELLVGNLRWLLRARGGHGGGYVAVTVAVKWRLCGGYVAVMVAVKWLC
jgi:hypothetical protein